jgi:hypothetical protein
VLFNISFKEYWFSGKLSILLWSQVDKANKFKLGRHNLLLAGVSDNLSSVSVELVKQLCFPFDHVSSSTFAVFLLFVFMVMLFMLLSGSQLFKKSLFHGG